MQKSYLFSVIILCFATGCSSTNQNNKPSVTTQQTQAQTKSGDELKELAGLKPGTYQAIIGVDFGEKYSIHYEKDKLTETELLDAAKRICGDQYRQATFISNEVFVPKFSELDPNDWEYKFACR